jgi:phytoene dehydrogenase-like protein
MAYADQVPVVIVGAGLSGLSAATHLHRQGYRVILLESADRPGGRVVTDHYQGYQLDRGFQVFLSAYPEAKKVLNYRKLELSAFIPGAMIRSDSGWSRLCDPIRRPQDFVQSLTGPIGLFSDRLKILSIRLRSLKFASGPFQNQEDKPALQFLEELGVSPSMIQSFFRPFFGGVSLQPDLQISQRLFLFLFRMFASGPVCLPAEGIGAIPNQLVASLPPGSFRPNSTVLEIFPDQVILQDGESLPARAVIVATDSGHAAKLLHIPKEAVGPGMATLYFSLPHPPPVSQPFLLLNGDPQNGPINHMCFPSQVHPTYAPKKKALASVAVLAGWDRPEAELVRQAQQQLVDWFGPAAGDWAFLRGYQIREALPPQDVDTLSDKPLPSRIGHRLYVCGDYRHHGSMQGAFASGRMAAEAAMEEIQATTP